MPIDAQRLAVLESSPAHSAKGARTDWFLIVPGRRGGGEIVATIDDADGTLPEDLTTDLAPESGGRPTGKRVGESGRTAGRRAAPKGATAGRLHAEACRNDGP